MKNKLEQLLNSLIEKGWKPRNVISKNTYIYKVKDKINLSYSEFLEDEGECMHEDEWYSLRDLVSKGSGLWQFVCENGMVKNEKLTHNWVSQVEWGLDVDCKRKTTPKDYEYRLIESSLKDESELEDFILDNVKIGNI